MAKKKDTGVAVTERPLATPNLAKGEIGSAFESPDALLQTLETPFEKYQKPLLIAAGVLMLAVAGFFGYRYYQSSQNADALQYSFPAVNYFEADSLSKALKGDGTNDGLLTLSDGYSATKAGNLASFYAGAALLKQGKFDDAIAALKDFSADDLLVQARAYALIGDAYLEKKDAKEAMAYYQKAATHHPNKYFTPSYLMKLGIAAETARDTAAALRAYDEVIVRYFDSQEAPSARKYKARLQATQ